MLGLAMAVGIASSPLVSAPAPEDGLALVPSKPVAGPRHSGRAMAPGHRKPPAVSFRSTIVLGYAGLVVLHVALLPFGVSNVLDSQPGQRFAASWVPTVRSSLSAVDRANTPTTVLPLTMPALFVPGGEAPFQLEQPFLALLPEWRNADRGPVRIIAATGHLEPARALSSVTVRGPQIVHQLGPVYDLSEYVDPNGDACFKGKTADGQFRIALPRAVRGEQIAVDLRLTTARALTLTPFTIDASQVVTLNSFSETLPIWKPKTDGGIAAEGGNHRRIQSAQFGSRLLRPEHAGGNCGRSLIHRCAWLSKGRRLWIARRERASLVERAGSDTRLRIPFSRLVERVNSSPRVICPNGPHRNGCELVPD